MTSYATSQSSRIVTTAVPFLLISPDARAAGMGDMGVATSPDTFSQQWNSSKYIFTEKESEIGFSYTPYLSKLVNDIFLANVVYYKRKNNSAWSTSFRYFSIGSIQFNDFISGTIVQQQEENPYELTIDFSYNLRLGDKLSMGVAGRYIRSDLKLSTDFDASSANSLGIDISMYYQGDTFSLGSTEALVRLGWAISNIGPPLRYDEVGQTNFIPTNLKLGAGIDLQIDSDNSLGFYTEFNKLLVPSPVGLYNNDNTVFLGYQQPDLNFLQGIFSSFNDAPGGISEELQEVTWAVGLEYRFLKNLAVRLGYFNESVLKGSRKFFTLGLGIQIDNFSFDASYLYSVSQVNSPLENTVRLSVAFDLL